MLFSSDGQNWKVKGQTWEIPVKCVANLSRSTRVTVNNFTAETPNSGFAASLAGQNTKRRIIPAHLAPNVTRYNGKGNAKQRIRKGTNKRRQINKRCGGADGRIMEEFFFSTYK